MQDVARRARHEPVRPELLAQARDVDLDALGSGRRRPVSPQFHAQLIGRDDLVGAQQQDRQQQALFQPPECERVLTVGDLQGAEDAEFHLNQSAAPDRTTGLDR